MYVTTFMPHMECKRWISAYDTTKLFSFDGLQISLSNVINTWRIISVADKDY